VYGNLKELISSLGGEAISDEAPKIMTMAYPMFKTLKNVRTKFETGYFGWFKFSMDPEKTLELKKKLDLDLNIIRFLLIKTVKENTIASKRFVHREGSRRKVPSLKQEGEAVEAAPIDKEEVDKEIEAMIAE
jgi:ribosomal protein S6